jgi:anthranilate phosphoribosyltransferase
MSDSLDTKLLFQKLFDNKLEPEIAKEFLISLYNRGETSEDIAEATSLMRSHLLPLSIKDELRNELIDNCGTGGDKSNSFNISTTVSILLNACGCLVAKHGNRSITSKSGSADMLEALGVNLNISLANQAKMLEDIGFVFMFAVNHHPVMKHIMPIRKTIPHRTIFNILGALSNPAGVKKQLIGVFSDEYLHRVVKALTLLDTKRAIVVSSKDGMDEVSISDITYATMLKDGQIDDFIIDPQKHGFSIYDKQEIVGGDATFNAKITKDILLGETKGAKLDIVLLNSAVALFADGVARDIQDGIEMAKDAIYSKKAILSLNSIVEVSNKL